VFQVTSGNVLRFTHTTTNIDSTGTLAANAWVHVAVVREGTGSNQTKLYINGVQDGQGTVSTDFTQTEEVRIGTNRGGTEDFAGYISNVRFVKGSALYTTGFTPSTVPLTTTSQGAVSSEVELLTCQSNRFRDNSSNNFAITRNGNVRVTPWSPFAPTSAYDPATNGGSGYFDGTGDYLTTPSSSAFGFGTGDITVEFWYYHLNRASVDTIFGLNSNNLNIYIKTTGVLGFYDGTTANDSSQTVPLMSWNHIAFARSGTTVKLYFNGVEVLSVSNSTNYSDTNAIIGTNKTNADPCDGYISNLRVVKGTAVYTSAFTPPTAPVTNITNTSLLLNFTNAGIFDTAGDSVIETVGNAQIDTAVKKYGSGSVEFDGSGDRLLCYSPRLLPSGREPLTIEFWMRVNSISTNQTIIGWGNKTTNNFCGVQLTNAGNINFYNWGNDLSSSGVTIATNTWYYIVCQYDGNTKQIYIDGVLRGSASTTAVNITATDRATVGDQDGSNAEPVNGYIDDLRITKGFARYTSAFTPPTAELAIIGTVDNIVNNSTYGVYQLA
jgi:hypothetical protein